MRYIVGANAVIYVLSLFAGGGTLNFLCLDAASVLHGEIWRVFTYVLIPTSDSIWLIISLVFYYWLGESLERLWGSAKFTFYYASGTLLTALAAIFSLPDRRDLPADLRGNICQHCPLPGLRVDLPGRDGAHILYHPHPHEVAGTAGSGALRRRRIPVRYGRPVGNGTDSGDGPC